MPWTEREPGRGPLHGPTVWRVVIIVALLLAGFGLFLSARLFTKNHEAIAANKGLACSIGAFLVDVPVVKQPGITQAQFEEQVRKARDFLVQLRERDCAGLSAVTTAAINRQIRRLREAAPDAFGGAG